LLQSVRFDIVTVKYGLPFYGQRPKIAVFAFILRSIVCTEITFKVTDVGNFTAIT